MKPCRWAVPSWSANDTSIVDPMATASHSYRCDSGAHNTTAIAAISAYDQAIMRRPMCQDIFRVGSGTWSEAVMSPSISRSTLLA